MSVQVEQGRPDSDADPAAPPSRWESRPLAAAAVRGLILTVPLGGSLVVAAVLNAVLPAGPRLLTVFRIIAICAISTSTLYISTGWPGGCCRW